MIPFTYVMSFLFTKENVAQTITIFLHFVIAGIGAIVAGILRLIPSTYSVGDALVWVFKIIPSYCLTDSIIYQAVKPRLFLVRKSLIVDDLDVQAIGGDILLICCHFIFWTILLIMIEMRMFRCLERVLLRGKAIEAKKNIVQDEDVKEEELRVAENQDLKVRVHNFRKVYT